MTNTKYIHVISGLNSAVLPLTFPLTWLVGKKPKKTNDTPEQVLSRAAAIFISSEKDLNSRERFANGNLKHPDDTKRIDIDVAMDAIDAALEAHSQARVMRPAVHSGKAVSSNTKQKISPKNNVEFEKGHTPVNKGTSKLTNSDKGFILERLSFNIPVAQITRELQIHIGDTRKISRSTVVNFIEEVQ